MISTAIPLAAVVLYIFANSVVLGIEVSRGQTVLRHRGHSRTSQSLYESSVTVVSVSKTSPSSSVDQHKSVGTSGQNSRTSSSFPHSSTERETRSSNPRSESQTSHQTLVNKCCTNSSNRNIKESISLQIRPQQHSVASDRVRKRLNTQNNPYDESSHLKPSHLGNIMIRFTIQTPSSQRVIQLANDRVKFKTPPDKPLDPPFRDPSSHDMNMSEDEPKYHRGKRSEEDPKTFYHRAKRSHILGIKSHTFGHMVEASGRILNSSFPKMSSGDKLSQPQRQTLSTENGNATDATPITVPQDINRPKATTQRTLFDLGAAVEMDPLNASVIAPDTHVKGRVTEDLSAAIPKAWKVLDVSNKWCQPLYNVHRTKIIKLNCSGQDFMDVPNNVRLFIPDSDNLRLIASNFNRLSDLVVNTSAVKVNYLYLDESNVTDVERVLRLFESRTIIKLILRDNLVSRLTRESFADAFSLEYLDVSGNMIEDIESKTFYGSPLLKELNVSRNRITKLDKHMFEHNQNVEHLYFDGNLISTIENGTFIGLDNIMTIDLANNYLEDQLALNTDMFTGCSNITNLRLANSTITMISRETFRELKKLHSLDLAQNKLTHIPDGAFAHLQSLSLLKLDHNQLTTLTRRWPLPQTLQVLLLDDNHITDISGDAFNGLDLTNLFLNNNKLETLPMMVQMYLTTRKNITLSFNPWRCDCDLIFLIHFIKNSLSVEPNVICDVPLKTRMSYISENTVRCPSLKGCHGTHCPVCQRGLQRPVGGECVCMEGTYYDHTITGQFGCRACPPQTYKNTSGNGKCTPCSSGSMPKSGPAAVCMCALDYFTNSYGNCEKCPEGTYKDFVGAGSCTPCSSTDTNDNQCSSRHQAIQTRESNTNVWPIVIAATVVFVICVVVFLGLFGRHYRAKRRLLKRYFGKMNTRSHVLHVSMEDAHFSSVSNTSTSVEFRCSGRHSVRLKEIGPLIGRGAFGQVFEGHAYVTSYDKEPIKVAVKRLKEMASDDEVKNLREELEQMINVGPHPNIIGLYGSAVYEGQYCIIMEYADLGDLLTYLKTECAFPLQYVSVGSDGLVVEQSAPKVEDNANLMMFAWQIAKGMRHLEMHRFIHRDLAARNCLLTKGPIAKVSDFGLSKDAYEIGHYKRVQKDRVPFKWLSPEALLWGQYSCKSDVWAFGILIWELYTFGGTPYPQVTTEQLRELHEYGYRMSKPPACPEQLYRIMRACWREDPRQRPSFKQLEQTLDHLIQQTRKVEYIDLNLHGLKSSTPLPLTPEDLNDQVTSVEFVCRAKRQAAYQNRQPSIYQPSDGQTVGVLYTSVNTQSGDSQYNDENFPILVGMMSKGDCEIDSESTVTSGFQSMSSAQTM
ncbi:unnamed protein product [Lymnaea stagnalis]|uniref:Protein kinase domain-containing protein n=1 Tax=Lymnaea stagnalis TaxID=6523 RepID=A0AAV2HHH6_LYMST